MTVFRILVKLDTIHMRAIYAFFTCKIDARMVNFIGSNCNILDIPSESGANSPAKYGVFSDLGKPGGLRRVDHPINCGKSHRITRYSPRRRYFKNSGAVSKPLRGLF